MIALHSDTFPFCSHPARRRTHRSRRKAQRSMAVTSATAFLEILAPIAEAIPILGTPVKGAVEATSKILKHAQVCAREGSRHNMDDEALLAGSTIQQGED
jgi:hypothetical protein